MPLKAASISEIKHELQAISKSDLQEICIRLAKHKKENKELLSYLLFESHNENAFIEKVKAEIEEQFSEINKSNNYLIYKNLRKILKFTNLQVKFSSSKTTEAELLIFFCSQCKQRVKQIHQVTALNNMYEKVEKKIHAAIKTMHEDLQYDYLRALDKLAG
ncbi:MAG: hypothetical protein K2Q22_05295 [Cytophagales bacterium]|nr:hypothetical protein [Cytophagales bacterium]